MPKYNLYKIHKDKEGELIRKLSQSGLAQISEKELEGFNMRFFFSQQADEIDIWWIKTYRSFFEDLEPPKNLLHFGVFLISNEQICYAVSLGKAHFYLSEFCDTEFGLNLAERIIDKNDLKIKNSKYYKSAKSKMITTYQKGNQISFDSGESMHYIKSQTIDSARWGEVVSFGNSVHLNIAKEPDEITSLINHIEDVLRQPAIVDLPKVDIVKDKSIKDRLDLDLARAILGNQENSDINIEEFTMSGISFIFADTCEYSLYLKWKIDEAVLLNELSIESLRSFIRDRNINLEEKINDLQIKVHNEYGRDHTKPLKFYLDFIKEDERYCLIDGKWHKFNQSYINYLQEEVDLIELDYNPCFDISADIREAQFNQDRVHDGYLNYDKELVSIDGRYKVEKMDLYKDNVIYFVKIGNPQKLSYVIDQAINTVKILQNNADSIDINEEIVEVTGICLWMILDRRTIIKKLSEINSIILHMKLVEWKKITEDARFKPFVKINYYVNR